MSLGSLFIVSTPIGNLEDFSFRALKILKQVDLILCEDTRKTSRLCAHYQIKKSLLNYHQHSKINKINQIFKLLEQGKNLALVSDAGTPGISDPGNKLIEMAYKKFNNLNTMLGWAHSTVIANLSEKTNCKNALIDQFADKSVVENALKRKNLKLNLVQRTHAESDIVVAAASIIARASFVDGIDLLSDDVSIKLPKGAGAPVLAAGKKIFLKEGLEIFSKIAKLHFKTLKDIQMD